MCVCACLNVYNISCPFMFYANGPWDEREVMSSLRLPGLFYVKLLLLFFFHDPAFGHAAALVHLMSVQGFMPLLCSFCVVV